MNLEDISKFDNIWGVHLTARTLTLDLLTTLRRGAMPVRALVEAGALFGLAENNVRVSLSKLHSEGKVTRDERGRYRLGEATAALSDQLRDWRNLEDQHRHWHGHWLAAHRSDKGRAPMRRRVDRSLALLGFCELDPGLFLRPDNLRGGLRGVRERWSAVVGCGPAASIRLFELRDLDAEADRRARALWATDALTASYRAELDALAESCTRIPSLATQEAMVETFGVGASVVRHLNHDPLLPEAILDPVPRRALVEATREYEALGHRLWAPFLASHGAPHRGASQAWRTTLGPLHGSDGLRS